MSEGSKRVIYAALAANVAVAAAKFVAAAVTGSSAMLSEAVHSLIDSGDGGLLLIGQHLGAKPPDREHPYGHGREIFFWSFVVAIMIFAMGGGISVFEGISRIRHPEPMRSPIWNYVVLGASFVFEGISFLISRKQFARLKRKGESNLAAIRRIKNPPDFMILVEDSAALLGIAVAVLGMSLALWTRNPFFDGAASIAIGLLLAGVATLLGVETRGLLIGEGLGAEATASIRAIVEADHAVEATADALTTYIGPETVLLNLSIKFRRGLAIGEIEKTIERIEQSIQKKYPVVKRVFIAANSLEDDQSPVRKEL